MAHVEILDVVPAPLNAGQALGRDRRSADQELAALGSAAADGQVIDIGRRLPRSIGELADGELRRYGLLAPGRAEERGGADR